MLGIPAIVGLGESLLEAVEPQQMVALDGNAGTLVISPNSDTVRLYNQRMAKAESRLQVRKAAAENDARTANGRRVDVAANVGETASARDAIENGAEGIGLLRTEFLYLEDERPPSEEKQYSIYREIFEVMAGRPVIVRTLDIGGDKPPSYFSIPGEMNPFLGWRGVRISLEEQELFKTQIRAILRAALGHNARIMLPMVSDLEQITRTREIIESVELDLKRDSVEYAEAVPLGIMVETPAAAVLVDVLAEASDFLSIGTNDLTQYTLAVDRGNAKVANLFQPLHPSVLRLIKETIHEAHARGKWVGMCGELAGMQKAIPILLGFGLDEFSMSPRAIPEAKYLIGQLTDEQAREIASQATALRTALEIEDHMSHVLASLQ
jgi:phosphotransferase system enzyme I (PtsI)